MRMSLRLKLIVYRNKHSSQHTNKDLRIMWSAMAAQQCNSFFFFFGSILASYVRCFVLGDALGLYGSVPGIAAMCASFLAVELTLSS